MLFFTKLSDFGLQLKHRPDLAVIPRRFPSGFDPSKYICLGLVFSDPDKNDAKMIAFLSLLGESIGKHDAKVFCCGHRRKLCGRQSV